MNQNSDIKKTVCVIVAHPDDETLWAGGTILMHPEWDCKVFTLCRASDPDRAPKFYQALLRLGAKGDMADLDDGTEQTPLPENEMQKTILDHTDNNHFDLILTHGPRGEYTRHRRHEEVSKTVLKLWYSGYLNTDQIWFFAYSDGNKTNLPLPEPDAHYKIPLPSPIWKDKQHIITQIYGFSPDSWEAQTTPKEEAFWTFNSQAKAREWFIEKDTRP
jgi:LmbE family N-acetylglucosaminyl deacetylase